MKILIIGAHPDDEILGCGGTIARLVKEGNIAYSVILGEGITSRYNKREVQKSNNELNELNNQMYKANKIIGIKKVYKFEFPDNRFDTIPLLDIIKTIEKIKNDIRPDIIFTHYKDDLNIDHKITYEAVLTATRPMKNEPVKTIYSFEVPSSTEWKYPLNFSPNVFFDISKTIKEKLNALSVYQSEIKEYPHPRSLKAIKAYAQTWGIKVGFDFVEPFKLVRSNL
jgi:LmbE family N-acetylglucosaminyl deacetylase